MKKGWSEKKWRRIIRYKVGNEMRDGLYWKEEEKRKYRVCGGEEETWEHVWERCVRGGNREGESWKEVMRRILGGEGEGEECMRLEIAREGKREEEREKRGRMTEGSEYEKEGDERRGESDGRERESERERRERLKSTAEAEVHKD